MRRARDLEAQESPVSPTRIRSGGNEGLWDPWASAAAQRFGNVSSVSATLGCAGVSSPVLGTRPPGSGDATRQEHEVRVPSTPSPLPSLNSSGGSAGRPTAKAKAMPFVPLGVPPLAGQAGVPQDGGTSDQLSALGAMMQNLMVSVSQVSERLDALEGRPRPQGNAGVSSQEPSFGQRYGDTGSGAGRDGFERLGSPIRERREHGFREAREEQDIFSKSEKWLPPPPTPDCSKWTSREGEIEGFFSYVQSLRSWAMLASDKLANEISQSIAWPTEIVQAHLTQGQQARSARLFAILRQAFSNYGRVDALIRAFEVGAPIHNSPQKPFGNCGFELLRVLSLEFALRTRTEAICLRQELLKREFRLDTKSTHIVSDLLRAMSVETARYDKLCSTLPQNVSRVDLALSESDQAMVLIRNLPSDARQYVLLHAHDDSLTALREAGLKYERQQRLYNELGAVGGRLRELQAEEVDDGEFDEGWVEAVAGVKCKRCGKKHETASCTTDLKAVVCFKCGEKGHIGANCKNPSKKDKEGKGQANTGKGNVGKTSPGKGKQKGKGKGSNPAKKGTGKKGKMFELAEGEEEEYVEETEPVQDIQMCIQTDCAVCLEFELVESSFEHQRPLSEIGERPLESQPQLLGDPHEQDLTAMVAWLENVALEIEGHKEDLVRLRARREVWVDACSVFVAGGVVAVERFVEATCPFWDTNRGLNLDPAFGAEPRACDLCVACMSVHDCLGTHDAKVDSEIFSEDPRQCSEVPIGCASVHLPWSAFGSAKDTLCLEERKWMLPLLSALETQEVSDWWLVDSGATVSVLAIQNLKNYKIVSREPFKSTGFYAANGTIVKMLEKVKIEVQVTGWKDDWTESVTVVMGALVGETKNNILSTSSLNQNGWNIFLGCEGDSSMTHRSGLVCSLVSWGNCPWICLKGIRTLDGLPREEDGVRVVRFSDEVDEMHRARGHQPYDPRCKVCVASRSVAQHRRKKQDDSGSVIELHSDFFFIEGFKFLIVAELSSHMIGCMIVSSSTDHNRKNLSAWLHELGCLGGDPAGVLHVFTDSEKAVGSLFKDAKLEKGIKVIRASPQSPETNGLAERAVRHVKETFVALRTDLRTSAGLDILMEPKALHEVCMYVAHMHNVHVGVHGTAKSAREFLEGRRQQTPTTSLFGSIVLCELPDAIRKDRTMELPRFAEGAYLRPEFGSKASVCIVQVDGELRRINPKTIKLVLPLRWEFHLIRGFVERFETDEKDVLVDRDARQLEDDVKRVRVSAQPPDVDPVCPKSGPPKSWFDETGEYTEGCNACKALELGLSRMGKSHSSRCCQRYVDWLKAERTRFHGRDTRDVPGDEEIMPYKGHDHEVIPYVEVPPEEHEDVGEEYTPSIPDSPKGVLRDSGVDLSKEPSGPVPKGFEDLPGFSRRGSVFDGGADVDMPDGTSTSSASAPRGSKRPAEEDTEELSDVADSETEKRGLKRTLDPEEFNCLADVELVVEFLEPTKLCGKVTSPTLVGENVSSIFFGGSETKFKVVNFCGVKVKVWQPQGAIDDSTLEQLRADHCFDGMLTEIENLDKCEAGFPVRRQEAVDFTKRVGTKILTARWVTNFKIVLGQDGVRARIVIKDFATSKAKSIGASSPTPSVEGLKCVLAIAAQNAMYLTALDVSAAFMHTPLKEKKYCIKMPLSVTWVDGSPLYLVLSRALNGLRPASREWLDYCTGLVEPLGLRSDSREPCILSGSLGFLVIYVDDILCVGFSEDFGKKVHGLLAEHVPTKFTGAVDPVKGGRLKFVGRFIQRLPGDPRLFIFVEETYLDGTFKEFQIGGTGKVKSSGISVPGIRATLEGAGDSPFLSPEGHSRFRRALGKIAWLSQTLEYLHIFVCLLSTGQQAPQEVHEKGLRQVLRFLYQDKNVGIQFPSEFDFGGDSLLLLAFCDASHAPMRTTQRRGISGAVVVCMNCVIKCFARHQTAVSLSTCESELFAIQATMQEVLGLQRLVFRLFEAIKIVVTCVPNGVRLCTDSASARDLINSSDIPRRSRHTEVRVFWVREQLEQKKVEIEWIKGTANPSDMMTKVLDTRTFMKYREQLGFVRLEGVLAASQMMNPDWLEGCLEPLTRSATKKADETLLFIELCCEENSSLRLVCGQRDVQYIGITKDGELPETVRRLSEQIEELKKSRRVEKIHCHASCPCVAGSPIRNFSSDQGFDFRFADMEELVSMLPRYRKLCTSMSLEWPVINSLWKCEGVKKILDKCGLHFAVEVRLCQTGCVSRSQIPVGKRLKIVSTSENFAKALSHLSVCSCSEHASFNDVEWTSTGFYNKKLAESILKGVRAVS